MLVLSRKEGEKIFIGDEFTLITLKDNLGKFYIFSKNTQSSYRIGEEFHLRSDIFVKSCMKGKQVKVYIEAPRKIQIHRDDIVKNYRVIK